MATTKAQDKTLAQKLADIVTNKTAAAKTEKKTTDEQPKTLSQKLMDINDKAFEERKKMFMSNKVGETKAKRGPSMSSRISGLGKLQTI